MLYKWKKCISIKQIFRVDLTTDGGLVFSDTK